jgi:hypothetical protein
VYHRPGGRVDLLAVDGEDGMARQDEPHLLVAVAAVAHLVVLAEQFFALDGTQRIDVEGLNAELAANPHVTALALLCREPVLERQAAERRDRHRLSSE